MYFYNVSVYYKNTHKTYKIAWPLWTAQQTESGSCSKEHMQEGDEDMQVQAWHLKKSDYNCFFFSRSATAVWILFVTIQSLGTYSASIMQYHYDTQKKLNIILPEKEIHNTPWCSHLWEYYKERIS